MKGAGIPFAIILVLSSVFQENQAQSLLELRQNYGKALIYFDYSPLFSAGILPGILKKPAEQAPPHSLGTLP
jgi:hypothetical protein